jgi:hypothetical protein
MEIISYLCSMKKYYVYELYNLLGTIEYVGQTGNPIERFNKHTTRKPQLNKNGEISSSSGKFYRRTDITMNIVKEFDNRKDAREFEYQLQKEYGLKADRDIHKCNTFRKGKPASDETKLKLSESHKGKTLSLESRLKISKFHKGLAKPKSIETRLKISESSKGKITSAETKLKQSEALKLYWNKKRTT